MHEHACPDGQKDRDRVRALIHDCQIRLAIAVEIGRGDRNWIGARTESRRQREGAPNRGSQEDRHTVGTLVRHSQIDLAVSVEVSNRQGHRRVGGIEGRGEHERTVSETDQDRYALRARVGNRQVELAVVVEIGRDDRPGLLADGVAGPDREGSVAVAFEDRDFVGTIVRER